MKTVTDRLWVALAGVTKLRHPSISRILRNRGFSYEADCLDELVAAFDQMATEAAQTEEGGGQRRSG